LLAPTGQGVADLLALGPIGVLPERQRTGIGATLMRRSIEIAEDRGAPALVLLGHPEYYVRFGFEPARALGIEPPADWPDEAWMARRCRRWSRAIVGRVEYPAAFGPL
jgi:putative acetyltransferase